MQVSVDESKAVMQRLVDAFNERDFEALEDLFAPDYVNHNPPPFPGFSGDRDSQLRVMRGFTDAVSDARAEVAHIIAEGDLVVLHDFVRGTNDGDFFFGVPATGKQVQAEFVHIWRIADGRIAERWGLIDGMSLMQQLGAMPA